MVSPANQGVGLPSEAAQAALCAVLALCFALGGDRLAGIEGGFYDLAQRLSASAPDAQVVIVNPESANGDLWALPRLDELLLDIKVAGARAIIPAAPAPPAAGPEDGAQQQRVAEAVLAAGNVILGLATSEHRTAADSGNGPGVCAERVTAASARYATSARDNPNLATLEPATPLLCEAAAAIGHVALLTDRDGVVRRAAPDLTTDAGIIPSTALAAVGAEASRENGSGRLARFYRSPEGTAGFRVISAAEILDGQAARRLRGAYVVIGNPEAGALDSVRTPLASNSGTAVLIATDIANYLSGDHLRRPGWGIWVEIGIALLLAIVAVFGGRLRLPTAALVAVLGAVLLLVAEFLLVAIAGLWIRLAGLALFCLTGSAMLQLILQVSRRARAVAPTRTEASGGDGPGASQELDLGFSVLRQQPTTDRTKVQLYQLAMEHGKKRDYAKAERVFRHLAARDPGYRDVAEKLVKLSGARGVAGPIPRPKELPTGDPLPVRRASGSGAQADAISPVGRTLGRYELDRVIGRGAMATVYLGRDPTINRRVAIKILPLADEFADNDLATARSQFLREAESAGRLNHPYIISIHDAGEDNRVAYLAMEYFEGKPLSHYAQLGRLLPPRVVIELMARAAEALHYAHGQNVVHRDVKPANLMYDQGSDRLKLTDFGIARLTDCSRTRTGIILGTPSYMSPEQLSASAVSGQTDLYSLGVTMYHLLTGSPPFQADSIPKLMDKIVHHRHRPIADIRDDVPACVDEILDHALAKNPADRYESGKAMALALRECCSRLPSDIL